MVRLGEPVISGRPMPPPRVNDEKRAGIRGVERRGGDVDVVAVVSAAMNAGTVTALAREAPCGSAQAIRTKCRFSFWTPKLELFRLPALVVGPEAVLVDEWIAWRSFAAGDWRICGRVCGTD